MNIQAPVTPMTLRSPDGAIIRAYRCGKGPLRWLLPPGLGTPFLTWKYIIERFQDQMTIATWEPRACYASTMPPDPSHIGIPHHLLDAETLIHALDWDDQPFVAGGWSMAVEIALELYDKRSDQIQALLLFNGAFEHVLKTAFQAPGSEAMLKAILKLGAKLSPLTDILHRWALSQPWVIAILNHTHILARNDPFIRDVLKTFTTLNLKHYLPMIIALNDHSARKILPRVQCPTLITAGTEDKMTPLHTAQIMHQSIPHSILEVFEGGTHYTPVEFPTALGDTIQRFLTQHGLI